MTHSISSLTRRRFVARCLAMSGGAALLHVVGTRLAHADQTLLEQSLARLLGDRSKDIPESDALELSLPEIAEHGNIVPLEFEVESPMTADDHVKSVHVFADGNPLPDVASFHFTPASGRAAASTRIRLARTQNVLAVAEMSDGSVLMAKQQVEVTIGGCGG